MGLAIAVSSKWVFPKCKEKQNKKRKTKCQSSDGCEKNRMSRREEILEKNDIKRKRKEKKKTKGWYNLIVVVWNIDFCHGPMTQSS